MRSLLPVLSRLSRPSRATLMLVFGLMVVAMLSFGSSRVVRAEAGGFFAEVCGGKGAVKGVITNSEPTPHPDSHHEDGCCKLCGTALSLLSADSPGAVLPAPTFARLQAADHHRPPALLAPLSYPPRGPPLG